MFIRSAASDTLQGRAIQAINSRWGADFRRWTGRETIGIPVCKKKYSPFSIRVKRNEDGTTKLTVERMYGCHVHSHLRKSVIERNGERPGWEPFGQWSLRKARAMARRMMERMNGVDGREEEDSFGEISSDDDCNSNGPWKSICNNGICAWKMKDKYDDVFSEIHNSDELEELDNR